MLEEQSRTVIKVLRVVFNNCFSIFPFVGSSEVFLWFVIDGVVFVFWALHIGTAEGTRKICYVYVLNIFICNIYCMNINPCQYFKSIYCMCLYIHIHSTERTVMQIKLSF